MKMNPVELTSAVTAVANALACGRSADEVSILSALFVQLGDTLATIALQKSLCCDCGGGESARRNGSCAQIAP